MSTRRLSILLLTEDSGRDGYDTLHALMKEALKLVDPLAQVRHVHFEPLQNQAAREAVRANVWKSTSKWDHAKQVDLVRHIATKVMEDGGFVFFHFDGDRIWSHRGTSENVQKFGKKVVFQVEQLVRGNLRRLGLPEDGPATLSKYMGRLFAVTPFYSIEAWIFQNTREAARLCHEEYGGKDVEIFEQWEADRSRLDEVQQPKEKVCLGAKHNLGLATTSFPARVVHATEKSFHAVVEKLASNQALREALASTYA